MRVELVVEHDLADEPVTVARVAPEHRRVPPPRSRPTSASIPPVPDGRYPSRQQLNVRITNELHWALRASSFLTNRAMSEVITAFLGAYAADPELWLGVFSAAAENGVPVAEALNPAIRAALSRLLDED